MTLDDSNLKTKLGKLLLANAMQFTVSSVHWPTVGENIMKCYLEMS